MKFSGQIELVADETQALVDWAADVTSSEATYFRKAQQLAQQLGAHYRRDGLTQIGFWTPELAGDVIQSERQIYLEIFTPLEPIDFRAPEQIVSFRRDCVQLTQQGEYVWGVISGMRAGTRQQAGSLYWLRYRDDVQNQMLIIRDPLAYSLPYGVFAPAELYDIEKLQQQRADLLYFEMTGVLATPESKAAQLDMAIPRLSAPVNILQIHVPTASAAGDFAGLTHIYKCLSEKLATNQPLTAAEENYVGYDAIQLLPIEPTIEYRLEDDNSSHDFFSLAAEVQQKLEQGMGESDDGAIQITLRKPDTLNWGYDVPILGSSAVNPALLGSLRPDELIDFIATLHNFSQGPIQVIYDLVYGHADNQSLEVLSHQFMKGPNMYGQDLNHQLPIVRAILLEMQRRKINTGADGIRVDGGQDFRFFNPISGLVEQDDAYLLAMSDVVQELGSYQRLLFTIFEDGRPWPQEGWEETSTYRDLVELKPESYQWGPLIFAHNTPSLKGFWDTKWRRICEVIYQGDRWITGCANHDTVRRGNQIDLSQPINWNLGQTLSQVLNSAYDNPATQLWVHGFSPGLPMDFLNANMKAPWGFFRNTDERYGVKVVSEEAGFLDWQVDSELYRQPEVYCQLKALGFNDFDQLRQFTKALRTAMIETDYDLELVAQICRHCLGDNLDACEVEPLGELNTTQKPSFLADLDVPKLKTFALAFMEDGHELCRVSHYESQIQAECSHFNLTLRQYRHANPWLRKNLTGRDRFNRISDDERTIFYGLRTDPTDHSTDSKQVVMVAHMGGEPTTINLGDWLQLNLDEWQVAIATPGLDLEDILSDLRAFELKDSQGLLLEPIKPIAEAVDGA
ncbi:MAG: alpha-amylase [Cyanothece sp. SIO1E1]|nr:alpha-amylase [Cyanothece sp. SIO1E1]